MLSSCFMSFSFLCSLYFGFHPYFWRGLRFYISSFNLNILKSRPTLIFTAWKSDLKGLRYQKGGTDTERGTYTGGGMLVLIYLMSRPCLPFTVSNSYLKQLRYGLLWKIGYAEMHRRAKPSPLSYRFLGHYGSILGQSLVYDSVLHKRNVPL